MSKLKSRLYAPLVFFLYSFFCTAAWGASGSVTITSPDPNQVYETDKNFSVKGTYRMDSNDSGSIWVPAGDSRLPNCKYGGWIYPGGYYNGDWGEGTIGIVNYTVDGVYKSQIGYVWWNVWGYDNIGDDNSFNASVAISGLDPETDHEVVINLQKAWGAQCYDPYCHGYGCGGSWTFFQVNGDIIDSKTLNFRIVTPCNLKINSFSGNKEVIDPSAGESVSFTGDMTETSGKTVTWTVSITDSSGASIGRTFSGTGKNPSITWDGKDSFGKIVDDGLYTATLEAQTEDGKCKKSATAQVTVKSSCVVGNINISREFVAPQGTGAVADITKADISITLRSPAPSSACIFSLSVEPVDNTGGHLHAGGKPTGSLSSSVAIITIGEQEAPDITYTSGEVAGTEKIIVSLVDQDGKVQSREELSIDVKMTILGPLADGEGWWGLVGETDIHPDNHYGAPYTVEALAGIAIDYVKVTGTRLDINDMSLPWGGLFDICGNWSSSAACSQAPNGGHTTHRKGTSADINRNVYDFDTHEYILINCEEDDDLADVVANYSVRLVCESRGRKHIDFH